MAYSPPSPSEICSNSSNSSLSDCESNGTRASTVCMTIEDSYPELFRITSEIPVEQLSQRHHGPLSVTPAPGAMAPMSAPTPTGSTTPSGTTQGGNSKLKNSSRRQYAGEDDWRRHREKISSLYRTKRLKDVMAIMENEHGLYATERMYKARFKDWGLQKNVTAAEVQKLMQKVEQEQQRQHQKSPPRENGRLVLDVGDDLDVKRIQKYMKRRPKGLDKLRKDPHRPLDVIKALSVDTGKGHGMVSIATVKLEEREQLNNGLLKSPPGNLISPSSPGSAQPADITRLLQIFVDNGFDAEHAYSCSPPTAFTPSMSPQWSLHSLGNRQSLDRQSLDSQSLDSVNSSFQAISSRDEIMLDFVLRFWVAHMLLDQGFTQQGYNGVNMCLESLAICLQQHQMPGLGTRPATMVTLWALLAALEVMVCFKHVNKLSLQMLYQRLVTSCAAFQPTMAEIVRQLSQLGSGDQEAAIRQAQQIISGALFTDIACYGPLLETYARTVDVAISSRSAIDKVQAMHTLAHKAVLPESSTLDAWLEMRIALVVPEDSSSSSTDVFQFANPFSLSDTAMPPSLKAKGSKIASGLDYVFWRIRNHKSVGNWQTALKLASQAASVAEMAWGHDGEMAHRFRLEAEVPRPPEQIPGSMAAFEPDLMQMDLPLGMSFNEEDVQSLGWQQKPGQGHAEVPAYASLSQWNAQVAGNFGNPGGLMYDHFF